MKKPKHWSKGPKAGGSVLFQYPAPTQSLYIPTHAWLSAPRCFQTWKCDKASVTSLGPESITFPAYQHSAHTQTKHASACKLYKHHPAHPLYKNHPPCWFTISLFTAGKTNTFWITDTKYFASGEQVASDENSWTIDFSCPSAALSFH